MGEITEYAPGAEEAAADPRDAAVARTQDLAKQAQHLDKDLETQQEARCASPARLQKRVRAAYQGEDLVSITLVLTSLMEGAGAKIRATKTYKEPNPVGGAVLCMLHKERAPELL